MGRRARRWSLVLGAVALACGGSAAEPPASAVEVPTTPASLVEDDPPARHDSPESFETFLEGFLRDVALDDLDAYWSERGLVVRNSPGAYLVVRHFENPDDFAPSDSRPDLGAYRASCVPIPGPRPSFDCDGDDGYDTTDACLRGKVQVRELVANVETLVEHELISEADAMPLLTAASLVQKHATHFFEDTQNNLGFFFALEQGKWKLLYLDAVIPCDA